MLILIVDFLFVIIVCHVSHIDHDGGKCYSRLSNIKNHSVVHSLIEKLNI